MGEAVGNDIEVVEAIETLQGKGPEDFRQICVEFAAYMLYLGEIADLETSRKMVEDAIDYGKGIDKFAAMVKAQGAMKVIFIIRRSLRKHLIRKIS